MPIRHRDSCRALSRGLWLKRQDKGTEDVQSLLNLFATLNLDYESGKIWGELTHSMKSGTIGIRDLIASIALANRQVVITKNKKMIAFRLR